MTTSAASATAEWLDAEAIGALLRELRLTPKSIGADRVGVTGHPGVLQTGWLIRPRDGYATGSRVAREGERRRAGDEQGHTDDGACPWRQHVPTGA